MKVMNIIMQKMNTFAQEYSAQLFLYIIGIVFACVIAIEVVQGIATPNPIATGYVALVVGYAINSHGFQQGVNNTNDTTKKVAVALDTISNVAATATPLVHQIATDLTVPPTIAH